MSIENEEKAVTLKCDKNCCIYTIIPYKQTYYSNNIHQIQTKIKKAGCFIYTKSGKVLLVQSRGQMWGPPKGTIKQDEDIVSCAIREVEEETGISINPDVFKGDVVIKSKAQYFFVEKDHEDEENSILKPQAHIEDNDANGIGWFCIDCLNDLIKNGKIYINQHCRLLIKRVFNKDIIYS